MKRILSLMLVAFAFVLTSVASFATTASAAPMGDPSASGTSMSTSSDKAPAAAMDKAMKSDAAPAPSDAAPAPTTKKSKHHKKHSKKSADAAASTDAAAPMGGAEETKKSKKHKKHSKKAAASDASAPATDAAPADASK